MDLMRKQIPPEALARDARFNRVTLEDRFKDARMVASRGEEQNLVLDAQDVADRARRRMHGIFVGEIQALEGAGRTAFDFESPGEVPFELKLDMARQCWDEARHVEISVKLGDHMGSEIGEFAEQTLLYEAGCNTDPVLRLCGVNRALEGLAIDVFNTMREFGEVTTDPV